MSDGKQYQKNTPASGTAARSRGLIGLLVILALVVVLALGGTVGAFAQLKDTTGSVTETYSVASVTCTVDGEYKITNTGNIPALIRARVVANRVNDNGDVYAGGGALPALSYGEGWTEIDGCLYYNMILAPNASTTAVVSPVEGLQIVVLAEAIQATPADAAKEAWGVQFNNGTWSAVAP